MKDILLYLRLCDRWMGTEHPLYVQAYDKIQSRRFGEKTGSFSLKKVLLLLVCLGGIGLMTARVQTSIEGTWKDHENGGIIEIYQENGKYFGQLIGADNPEEHAKIQSREEKIVILRDFEQKSDTKFCCGTIFQPRHQRVISGTLILKDKNTLEIKGRYGVFRGSSEWKRL